MAATKWLRSGAAADRDGTGGTRGQIRPAPIARRPGPGHNRERWPSTPPIRRAGRPAGRPPAARCRAVPPRPPRSGGTGGPDWPETGGRSRPTRSSNTPTAPAGSRGRCRGVVGTSVGYAQVQWGKLGAGGWGCFVRASGPIEPAGACPTRRARPDPRVADKPSRDRMLATGTPASDFMVKSGPRFGLADKSGNGATGREVDWTASGDFATLPPLCYQP